MSYTTQSELVERFGEDELIQMTDKDGSAGAIVPGVVDKAITDADTKINSYVAVEYALPLPEVPSLVGIASDIARFELHENRATDEVIDRYIEAIKWLEGIAKGSIKLVDSDGKIVGFTADLPFSGSPQYCGSPIIYTDELLDKY